MQKIYKLASNCVYKLTAGTGNKVRNAGLFLCCAFLVWLYFFRTGPLEGGETEILGSAVAVAMTVLSINQKTDTVRWNKWIYYPMVLFGLGILLIGQIHSVGDGFVMYAIDLMFIFPCFYFVWCNRRDHDTLFRIISAALMIGAVISFIYCIYLAVRGEMVLLGNRVAGHKSNPNYLGMMGVAILISGLYTIFEFTNNRWISLLAGAVTGIGVTYVIISVSRTSMIAAVVCIITAMVFAFKRKRHQYRKSNDRIWISFILIALMMTAVIMAGTGLNDINYRALQNKESAEATSDNTVSTDVTEAVTDRMGAGGKSARTFSSGRTGIWKVYCSHLSWFGHPVSEIMEELQAESETRAHNNFLEYYYRCGYIVGTIYLIFFIATGLAGLRMLVKKKYCRASDAFVVMIIGTYSVFALLEISMLAFIRLIPCLFFLSISPVLITYENNK